MSNTDKTEICSCIHNPSLHTPMGGYIFCNECSCRWRRTGKVDTPDTLTDSLQPDQHIKETAKVKHMVATEIEDIIGVTYYDDPKKHEAIQKLIAEAYERGRTDGINVMNYEELERRAYKQGYTDGGIQALKGEQL